MIRRDAHRSGGSPRGAGCGEGVAGLGAPRLTLLRGVVLCGGRSRRMGTDKALLVGPDGRTLLERALATVEASGACAALACGAAARYDDHLGGTRGRVLDRFGADAGPLGALASALDASVLDASAPDAPAWTLTLPVDMPGVGPELLDRLWRRAAEADADLCLARGPRGIEPLLGAFGPRCGAVARELLAQGERRPVALTDPRHGLRAVELELGGAEAERQLQNLNHPADWERATLGSEAP